ncbi:NAD+ synthase [Candidatus Gottesmanbacteria bacterium]|nr:NAD+ synthase [Candidatus Gottesmanbacteria bacterium]
MLIDLSFNSQKITQKLINFIQHTLKKTGFTRLVIGLSGGIDSATSLALGVKAIGADNIYVCMFPYGELNKEGLDDAKLIVDEFKIPAGNIKAIDIKFLVDSVVKLDPSVNNIRSGNIMARMRMILLYDLSKKYNALVLGTENKTENLLGYFTRFGDEASDVESLLNLYKTQVKQLAKYLEVPEKIINKIPTAGMWQGQTDEGEFGFGYEEADKILYLIHEKKYKKEKIIKEGFDQKTVEKVIKRVSDNSFKHFLPYTPK